MGYYADLYFKVDNSLMPELVSLLHRHELDTGMSDIHVGSDYTNFAMYSLKWYDGYPEVDAINQFIESNSEQACCIVNGEDSHDTYVIGDDCSVNLYYSTRIELDGFNFSSNSSSEDLIKSYSQTHPEYFI